jgi:DNA-binding MarR family transcriptional regulator
VWIKRVVSLKDKRRYELQITLEGERTLAEVRQIIARHEAQFLAPLSQEERESLRELLAKLVSGADCFAVLSTATRVVNSPETGG